MKLRLPSPAGWLEAVLCDFDAFLLDHASSERKASAQALSLVAHYADREDLVEAMIDLAREELAHFQQVVRILSARGLTLVPDRRDRYVGELRHHIRRGSDDYFLDRLLLCGIVEARGCERFRLIASALPRGELANFYHEISASEASHEALFIDLARTYFPGSTVDRRLEEFLDLEAEILCDLPFLAALH